MKRRSGGGGNKLKVQVFSSCLEIQDREELVHMPAMKSIAALAGVKPGVTRKRVELEETSTQEEAVEMMEETIIDVESDEDEPEHAGGEELENVIVIDDEEDQPVDERYPTGSRLYERALEYLGHPDKAFEECVGIQDERLTLFEDGKNASIH